MNLKIDPQSILVFSNNELETKIIQIVLSNLSLDIDFVTTKKATFSSLNKKKYSIAIISFDNEKSPVFEFVRQIKGKATKIILLTSSTDSNFIEEAIKNGVSDFILKPISKDEILLRVQVHLKSNEITFGLQKKIKECKCILDKLKEEKSKFEAMFENAPIPIWVEDFSGVSQYFESLRKRGVINLEKHLNDHPEEVYKLPSLVSVKKINQRTVHFYNKKNKAEVIQDLPSYFTESSIPIFRDEIIAIWNGSTEYSCEIEIKVDGKYMTLLGHVSILPGHEKDLRKVLFSFVDITAKKDIEKKMINKKIKLTAGELN